MHSAEIKREIPFCTRKRILEYSGIEIRQFTHSAEIKREIPFCTRKRSETYIYLQVAISVENTGTSLFYFFVLAALERRNDNVCRDISLYGR